ncbi:MAG: hypothetical protein JWQ09_281 [Segetibacter sp.]|nr:hypothetical protein [Segetibacter sp.]
MVVFIKNTLENLAEGFLLRHLAIFFLFSTVHVISGSSLTQIPKGSANGN